MSAGYSLVNQTKKELISFLHINATTLKELVRSPVSSSIVTWYLLHNQGDDIHFVSDTYDDWPFSSGSRSDLSRYRDITETLVSDLIAESILVDMGRLFVDEDDPENIYIRDLRATGE